MNAVYIVIALIILAISLFTTSTEPFLADNRVEVRSLKYFYGPNEWNYVPTLEITLDIKEFEHFPSDRIPHLYDALLQTLPSIESHRCSKGYRGGFLERVKEGTYFGHMLEHITLELQLFTGFKNGMGRTRSVEPGVYKIAVTAGHHSRDSILECFQCALDLLLRLIDRRPVDLVDYQQRIVAATRGFGSNMLEIIYELKKRNIPYVRVSDVGHFIQVGYGNTQKRLWITSTGDSSGIAESIASDKTLTKQLLAQQGISVPKGELATSVADAVAVAEAIGYPVVVKPCNGNHANGVMLNLTSREEVEKAFPVARRHNKEGRLDVIVEQYIKGHTYRVTVVNYRVVAACRHLYHSIPVSLVGDGTTTIGRLIERIQAQLLLQNPQPGILVNYDALFFRHDPLVKTLAKKGYRQTDVLRYGVSLDIDLVYDGYQDETLPEDLKKKCELAARVIGLDIAGIDMIRSDSYSILEVNAGPDIRLHRESRHSVANAIVDLLFPSSPRFPIIGITGDGDRAGVNRVLTNFYRKQGVKVGSVGDGGVTRGNHAVVQNMLSAVDLEMAVIDNSSQVIDQEGLAYDFSSCAIILGKINQPPENSLHLLRIQLDSVRSGTVILNGDDPHVAELIQYVEPSVSITLYATSPISTPYRVVYYDASRHSIVSDGLSIPFDFTEPIDVVVPAIAAITAR